MVFIEFFDKEAIENVCSSIAVSPQRVYLLGDNKKIIDAHAKRYKSIFAARGTDIDFITRTVNKNKLSDIVSVLSEIIENEDDACSVDLTGGEDLMLVAMGVLFAKYDNLQMHRFNIRSNAISDCDEDGNTVLSVPAPRLSVSEYIEFYGGKIVYDDVKENGTHRWDMSDDFVADIRKMWEICTAVGFRAWNTQIGVFEAAERYFYPSDDNLTTVARLDELKADLKREKANYVYITAIIKMLSRLGLARINVTDTEMTIKYKNEQVKKCLTKSGQALEMITYLLAREAVDKDGEAVYNDVMTGVYIDWDGNIHTQRDEYDTVNEIDVIMMHNMVPVFVSCKNGYVDINELYKLNSVADKFGGKYAKKVLVATALDDTNDYSMYLQQRAHDMNIRIIKPDAKSINKFAKELKNAMC